MCFIPVIVFCFSGDQTISHTKSRSLSYLTLYPAIHIYLIVSRHNKSARISLKFGSTNLELNPVVLHTVSKYRSSFLMIISKLFLPEASRPKAWHYTMQVLINEFNIYPILFREFYVLSVLFSFAKLGNSVFR